jgi:glycosyltransferase involved in cell wall biosynthesis
MTPEPLPSTHTALPLAHMPPPSQTPQPPTVYPAPVVAPQPVLRAVLPSRQIKVIQLGPALDVHGGISTVEQHICDHLASHVSMRHIPTFQEGGKLARALVFARAARSLGQALANIEPCIVHIHFASRGSTLRKLILARMVLRAGRPLVLHAHGGAFDGFYRGLPGILKRSVCSILHRANVLIALSARWREFYVNECELSPSQVVVLPNPVSWSPEVPNRIGRKQVQFLFLGKMCEGKGTYDLVNAFAALPDATRERAQLVLAGNGDVEEIRRLAAPLGERVRVLSWVDSAERDRLLAESDVFVLPSYNEGVPMSLLEAMASGLPSIATAVGGIPDVMSHGVEGLLVEPARLRALTAAMARYIDDDTERLVAGRRAHDRARAFDVHSYARRLAEIYQRISPVSEMREMT